MKWWIWMLIGIMIGMCAGTFIITRNKIKEIPRIVCALVILIGATIFFTTLITAGLIGHNIKKLGGKSEEVYREEDQGNRR